MTYEQAVREYKEFYAELYDQKADYWTAQLAWSCFVDCLCKDGIITQKQWANWSTPFPYGKPLRKQKIRR